MASNEQTELTREIDTDSEIESKMTTKVGVEVRGVGIEQNRKRTQGHGQQCGDCTEER